MIRVRDDDVLMKWNWKKTVHYSHIVNPFLTLQKMHTLICSSSKLIHVPAIVCYAIQEFPDAISYIKKETEAGRMLPEIHGWNHIDYGQFTYDQAVEDLAKCKQWMYKNLGVKAQRFYVPWGGNSEILCQASSFNELELIDTSKIIRPTSVTKDMDDIEIFIHWWEGTENLEEMFKNNESL